MKPCLLYVTAPSMEIAEQIAAHLVEHHQAACVNILPAMRSVYRWEGKIEQADEVVLLIKTLEEMTEEAITAVNTLHPYDCPAILTLPIHGGHPEFLDWIGAEVGLKDADSSCTF